MKNILIIITIFLSSFLGAQLPYSWTTGVNPGWTSSNPSVNTLQYQPCAGYLSTSDCIGTPVSWYSYNNLQVTSYTSPNYNFTCSKKIKIDIRLRIDLDTEYDWFYFQYSIDGGLNWINPVSISSLSNWSNVNLSSYSPLTNWVNSNSNKYEWTDQLGVINVLYNIPASTQNKFRFIFESDIIINSYGSNIHYADVLKFNIICPSTLPIELISFNGENYNTYNYINWVCATETNNDYFRLERSNDAFSWSTITNIKGAGTTNTGTMYSFKDLSFKKDYNYYRLTQVDYNGESKISNIISIDNTSNNLNKEIIKVTNIIGQEVDINTPGVLIYQYSDGTYDKVYKN